MALTAEELAHVHASVVRSIETRDAALFASLYTEDGALHLPDGSAISGRAKIGAAFETWLEAGFVRQEVEVLALISDETLAVEEGRARGTFSTPTGDQVSESTYLITHRLQPDGRWLIHRDMWTAAASAGSATAGY